MSTFDKVRIWLGVLLYAIVQTFTFCVAAALACESADPLEWNDTIQFIIMAITAFIVHRLFFLTKQKIEKMEELLDNTHELTEQLDNLMESLRKRGRGNQ